MSIPSPSSARQASPSGPHAKFSPLVSKLASPFVVVTTADRVFVDIAALGDEVETQRARLGLEGKQVLLFVGSLAPDKRVEDLIDGYARLRETHPDCRLLIVVGGPHRAALERTAAEADADNVVLHRPGRGRRGALLPARRRVRAARPRGLALSEAMAHGLPVVASLAADGIDAT
jgi:glycosyltransferase involved in cell wall biosynthesis